MQQLIMNLVLNAAEAIDQSKNGSVIVKTRSAELAAIERAELVVGNLAPGFYVVLEIQDNGSGMNEAVLAKIFDPFFTTKFTGRGLGLSAVEGILRKQNGALEVQSTPEFGSTFRVYQPIVAGKRRDPELPVKSEKIAGTAGTILVVDDEEMVCQISQLALQNGGFSVCVARGGEEAIRILQSEKESPVSLIVIELSMPGMSGKQTAQKIRALKIMIPFLICGGYSEGEALKEFVGVDIAGYIQKPFTARQLAERVTMILNPGHNAGC